MRAVLAEAKSRMVPLVEVEAGDLDLPAASVECLAEGKFRKRSACGSQILSRDEVVAALGAPTVLLVPSQDRLQFDALFGERIVRQHAFVCQIPKHGNVVDALAD